MGGNKKRGKRSPASMPRGIPDRKTHKRARTGDGGGGSSGPSPFERASSSAGSSRVKFHVHNRPVPGKRQDPNKPDQSSLARSIGLRETFLRSSLKEQTKSNEFVDRRIGESKRRTGEALTQEEAMLRRVVRERARRSRRASKFALDEDGDEDDGGGLTHKGRAIDDSYSGVPRDGSDVILNDDDDDPYGGDLDKVDTLLHFGGGRFDNNRRADVDTSTGDYGAYGPASGGDGGGKKVDMADAYRSRKDELDDLIRRKKAEKAEKTHGREVQAETFETMDDSFAELAGMLQFRDKERERQETREKRKTGTQSEIEVEMDQWDKEMKEYQFERRVKATDRTRTPEEIAKDDSERLHVLETKRLARMSGDFDDDEMSDVSDDDEKKRNRRKGRDVEKEKKKKKKRDGPANPDEMSDSSDDDDDEKKDDREVRFTSDGLVYVDKNGRVVGKVGDDDKKNGDDNVNEGEEDEKETDSESDSSDDDDDLADSEVDAADGESDSDSSSSEDGASTTIREGGKVQANYQNTQTWQDGVVAAVRTDKEGNTIYDITYNDGDFEQSVTSDNVRAVRVSPSIAKAKGAKKTKEDDDDVDNDEEEGEDETTPTTEEKAGKAKAKRRKAKERARAAIPFVFEVPTTLDALHDVISAHASTGADASLIIERIHKTNSVRLDGKKNREKMQNFCDVLLRRFVMVGDAIFETGDGDADLRRYDQLNSLTRTLYNIAQDSPDTAGAVWSRRVGVFQKSLAKRLRDAEVHGFPGDACRNGSSAWPSPGELLLLRALVHVFPSTDRRHPVVVPAALLLGQALAQCPIMSAYDVTMGLFCAGLMLEYSRGAKRVPPEAISFLAGVLRLYADDDSEGGSAAAVDDPLPSLSAGRREPQLANLRHNLRHTKAVEECKISIEKDEILSESTPAAMLISTLTLINHVCTVLPKREIVFEISKALLLINGTRKTAPLPSSIKIAVAFTARLVSKICATENERTPLRRRARASMKDMAVKTLAPRMEDPSKYTFFSKDKGKSELQAERDRHRREYKREHKATVRELKLDGAFVENERRKTKETTGGKARAKRQKNFSWMEQEQASMNQQVAVGGGLLSGGGMGAAKSKARSGKLGIKKGGKF